MTPDFPLMMASSPPILTIPRGIRDKIWELLYIKAEKQDPRPRKLRINGYPHMKAAIYLVNSQLNQEHKENLLPEDKWINQQIYS